MKKIKYILIVLISILICLNFSGCGPDTEAQVEKSLPFISSTGVYEWVSPDGVHYWLFTGYQRYGVAPRYDNNGNLVIEDK